MSAYLKVKINGRSVSLHRYVYEQSNGPVPDGMVVHHINHDKHDNRISNLTLMTHAEHSAHHNQVHPTEKECAACGEFYEPPTQHRGRSRSCSDECRRELCRRGQLQRSGVRKISAGQAEDIRRRVAGGELRAALAREYGVSPSTLTRLTAPMPGSDND